MRKLRKHALLFAYLLMVTLTKLASVSGRLLALRKRVLPARRVLEELVSRKTTLVSEATLQFMGNMIGTLERLLADITANREILESAMNFSLTVMTHRTNMTMNRLAVVSTIFLPLTFLCGVYGMNFEVMPETSGCMDTRCSGLFQLSLRLR